MVRLFWMRVKKKKIFRPSSFVALMILFIRVCVWHILAEKYKGAERERERESDDDDGGCVVGACQKTSRQESLTSRVLDFHEDEQTTPRKSEIG
jgi:hypothetical protein